MNEERFRQRFRGALGEPPPSDLQRRLEANASLGPPGRTSSRLGPLAATLAFLIVAGLVGYRVVYQRATAPVTVKRSTVATASPAVSAVDPLNCRLPVVVMGESGPPGQLVTEPGFVDTHTGQYVKDGSASIADLPGGAFEGTDVKPSRPAAAVWYSASTRRWLPVGNSMIAPDGHSYLWVRLLPQGSNIVNFKTAELHRYDLTTARDHLLWSYAGYINVHRWDASGILLDTDPPPPAGGNVILWLIDPGTGMAAEQPQTPGSGGLTKLPGEGLNGFSYEIFGADAQGRPLYRIGSRQSGDQEWVFYESAPGQRVTIYKGTQGDTTGFDPFQAMGDGSGIWFSDYERHGLWYWDPSSGLHKIVVKGVPGQLAGPNSSGYVNPAGSCM